MMVDTEDLVCGADIADMCGVGRSAVSNWAKREVEPRFPEPVARVGMGPLYSRIAVLAWWQARAERDAQRLERRAANLRKQAADARIAAGKLRKAAGPSTEQSYTLTVP